MTPEEQSELNRALAQAKLDLAENEKLSKHNLTNYMRQENDQAIAKARLFIRALEALAREDRGDRQEGDVEEAVAVERHEVGQVLADFVFAVMGQEEAVKALDTPAAMRAVDAIRALFTTGEKTDV